jgi:hypothetical protein
MALEESGGQLNSAAAFLFEKCKPVAPTLRVSTSYRNLRATRSASGSAREVGDAALSGSPVLQPRLEFGRDEGGWWLSNNT